MTKGGQIGAHFPCGYLSLKMALMGLRLTRLRKYPFSLPAIPGYIGIALVWIVLEVERWKEAEKSSCE